MNAKEVIRFDIESLSAQLAFDQAHRRLRNLAGRFAAHHDAQVEAFRDREPRSGNNPGKDGDDSEYRPKIPERGRRRLAGSSPACKARSTSFARPPAPSPGDDPPRATIWNSIWTWIPCSGWNSSRAGSRNWAETWKNPAWPKSIRFENSWMRCWKAPAGEKVRSRAVRRLARDPGRRDRLIPRFGSRDRGPIRRGGSGLRSDPLVQLFALDRFQSAGDGPGKTAAHRAVSSFPPITRAIIDPADSGERACRGRFSAILFFVGTSEVFGTGFMRLLARWLRIDGRGPGRQPDSRHARRGLRLAPRPGSDSLSRGRALHRRHTQNLQEGRGDSLHSRCRCRLCRWRLKVSMTPGRAASPSRNSRLCKSHLAIPSFRRQKRMPRKQYMQDSRKN